MPRGRKPHTFADRQLMKQFAEQFDQKRLDFKNVEEAAKDLDISRASLYNYSNQNDLPRLEVLQRAHEKWGFQFRYGDITMDAEFFRSQIKRKGPTPAVSQPLLDR